MKNFLDQESIIYDNFIDMVSDRFAKLKYGIKRCSRPLCDDLVETRYELLQYQKNRDIICDEPIPPTDTYELVWGFGPIDPFGNEESLFFQFGRENESGATVIPLDFTAASAGNYLYWRIPSNQPLFNKWDNNITNYGVIPDIIWRAKVAIGGYDYYLSRDLYFVNEETTVITFSSDGSTPTDPIVNAGPDQELLLPTISGTLSGSFTQGTYPITNYTWTLQSGLPVTFGSPTSLNTTFTTSGAGTYVLRLTVYDTNSDAFSDTVTITVVSPPFRVYYGFRADNSQPLTEADILAADSIVIADDVSQYTLPLETPGVPGYIWFAERPEQPLKIKWQDTGVIYNNGFIGSTDDLFGPYQTIGAYRLTETLFQTQFDNPIQIKSI